MASETDPVSIQSEREETGNEFMENGELEEDVAEYEEHDNEGDDYTPLSSNEDPEQHRNYQEYKQLEKDINLQNQILERIKTQIQDIKNKPCPTRGEKTDLKKLYDRLEKEMGKLRCLIDKAMYLQNFGSRRHYRQFPLVTTLDEDNMNPILRTYETLHVSNTEGPTNHKLNHGWRESGVESSELDKSCSCLEHSYKDIQMSDIKEKNLMKDVFTALNECCNLKKESHQRNKHCTSSCCKNKSMQKLKNKIKCMQQAMFTIKEELCKRGIKKLVSDTCSHSNKRPFSPSTTAINPSTLCSKKKSTRTENFEKLKDNYLFLLTEFNKKDQQLKELSKKLRSSCDKCTNNRVDGPAKDNGGNGDDSELHLLRNRVDEMKEEQIEFKCLMREQSLQLDEYRNKYLSAQQKVEEQCALLEKLNMNNKRIEKQINLEVKEIRAKFQEKLSDLLQFPKLLENEQIKLAQKCKEMEELETKLVVVCKELKNLKSKAQTNNEEDCKPLLQRCQQELCQVKKNLEDVQQQRDLFCEELRTTKDDLDTLRSESAKIIARTKERAAFIKQQKQEQIDCLEKQLAQCRATACLSVSDRETVIREMQGQLNTLSYSFDSAQKQIRTLRNHIAYMSNENCFPAKC